MTLPKHYEPQLALLVKSPPEGAEWLHELKYDGYRIGARIDGADVRLISRNGKDWTDRFPTVRDAVRELSAREALLDGEVAVVLPDGRTSFQALQNTFAGEARYPLVYFVFDLLQLDGEAIARLPLEERKRRLRRLLGRRTAVLRYADHVDDPGSRVLKAACAQGAEGIVSKRRDLPYQPGRNPTWQKTKCVQRQEFVIGGFTDPEGSRSGIGAVLVGVHEGNGRLTFAGKVGTGFTQISARDLRQRLERIEQTESPFSPAPPRRIARSAHWVRPELVGEVAFTEWTDEGYLRHPSFQGLRSDKRPEDIVRERPASAAAVTGGSSRRPGSAGGSPAARRKQKADPPPRRSSRQKPHSDAGPPTQRARRPRSQEGPDPVIADVKITHPDRVLYPDIGLTKRELADYYVAIAEWMLPHVRDRPLTLVRCPQGVGTSCFYMKHSHVWAPTGLRRVKIREKTKIGEYLIADTASALVGLAQMDVLEIHTWNSTATRVEHPDRLVFDLDPGPAVQWPAIVAGARLLRAALGELGLRSFVKTTGGRGLHVVTPLAPVAGWDACLRFARALGEAVVRLDPRAYTTTYAKAGRESQILIDYLRNNRTNTSIAAYSTRARPGAPVSAPLDWDELGGRIRSDSYTARTIGRRLARRRADPWREYWAMKQRLPADAIERLAAVRA